MAQSKAIEEYILEARAEDRERFGAAVAAEKGPMAYSKAVDEDEQDELWMEMNEQYRDPQAFLMLLVPKEAGGMGLTPLAASLERYPQRRRLYEGAGASIEDQIKYAEKRRERIAGKRVQAGADGGDPGRPPSGMAVGRDDGAAPPTPQEGGY